MLENYLKVSSYKRNMREEKKPAPIHYSPPQPSSEQHKPAVVRGRSFPRSSFPRSSSPAITTPCCDVLPASNQARFLPFALLTRTKPSNFSFTPIWSLSFCTQLPSQQHNMLQTASSPSQASGCFFFWTHTGFSWCKYFPACIHHLSLFARSCSILVNELRAELSSASAHMCWKLCGRLLPICFAIPSYSSNLCTVCSPRCAESSMFQEEGAK